MDTLPTPLHAPGTGRCNYLRSRIRTWWAAQTPGVQLDRASTNLERATRKAEKAEEAMLSAETKLQTLQEQAKAAQDEVQECLQHPPDQF